MRDEIALDQATDYYDAVVRSDINRADNVQKNPERVKQLIEEGAESLKAMQSKIDTDKMKATSFLMELTGTGDYACCRKDGVRCDYRLFEELT